MKLLVLLSSAAVGWWASRHDEWFVQLGVIIVCLAVGIVFSAIAQIIRMALLGQAARPYRSAHFMHVAPDEEMKPPPIEWIPVRGTPDDPNWNPWYSPDHQNRIDPDHW